MISAAVIIKVQFYDLDPMQVVWHGSYVRFLEQARCALLDAIGYNYAEMRDSGYMWPVVDLHIKFVAAIRFGQDIKVEALLAEYENRLRITYRITEPASGALLTKASTTQVAVDATKSEMLFESPAALRDKVQGLLR